jgi:predicted nucleic acid-binding protein
MKTKLLYVADTYALIEFVNGSPNYKKFTNNAFITTSHAYVELCYYALRTGAVPEKTLTKISEVIAETDATILTKAALLRFTHKKEKLSYADCVGWAFAQTLGIPFLTGDQQFEGKQGVAFVR